MLSKSVCHLCAALRGAATLKARALKEVWNIAAVIPVEKGMGIGVCGKGNNNSNGSFSSSEELVPVPNTFLGASNQDLLARGTELLKRTRKGNNSESSTSHHFVTLRSTEQYLVCTLQVIFTGK